MTKITAIACRSLTASNWGFCRCTMNGCQQQLNTAAAFWPIRRRIWSCRLTKSSVLLHHYISQPNIYTHKTICLCIYLQCLRQHCGTIIHMQQRGGGGREADMRARESDGQCICAQMDGLGDIHTHSYNIIENNPAKRRTNQPADTQLLLPSCILCLLGINPPHNAPCGQFRTGPGENRTGHMEGGEYGCNQILNYCAYEQRVVQHNLNFKLNSPFAEGPITKIDRQMMLVESFRFLNFLNHLPF